MLTSPELELLWTWPGVCCFWSWRFAWPPSCPLILCPQWGLLQHMLLPSVMLAQCNYLKLSPPVLSFPLFCLYFASKGLLPPFLFCFVFSCPEIGCIQWLDLVPRLHLKDIVYFQNPQLCLCSRLQTSLPLKRGSKSSLCLLPRRATGSGMCCSK